MTTDILSPIANTNLHPIKSIWLYELMLLFTDWEPETEMVLVG